MRVTQVFLTWLKALPPNARSLPVGPVRGIQPNKQWRHHQLFRERLIHGEVVCYLNSCSLEIFLHIIVENPFAFALCERTCG